MSKNRNKQERTDLLAVTSGGGTTPNLSRTLNQFLQSLGEVLIDITALEVNTMVVEEITGDKFIAWETYREIYPISRPYLEQQGIHESLRDRYLELRTDLELEYRLLLGDPNSEFYDPKVLDSATLDNRILTDPSLGFSDSPTLLPNPIKPNSPEEILKTQKVLSNCRFLRCLRKMCELKAALDNRNKLLLRNQLEPYPQADATQVMVLTDTICAQTVIQLDGDVINRYARDIFNHPHREVILDIHREGVMASEKQWRGLLEFIIGLVQATLQRG